MLVGTILWGELPTHLLSNRTYPVPPQHLLHPSSHIMGGFVLLKQ